MNYPKLTFSCNECKIEKITGEIVFDVTQLNWIQSIAIDKLWIRNFWDEEVEQEEI